MDNWVGITQLKITLPHLPKGFHGYRIIHLSDFHIGTWLTYDHLLRVVNLVHELTPHVIVITGDFVTNNPSKYFSELRDILHRLTASDGCYAILGNHDHWSNPTIVREIIHSSHVKELSNRVIEIKRGNDQIYIAGVDDYMEDLDDLPKVIAEIPEGYCAILLAHEPDYAEISSLTGKFDLQLSGHSHGGQVVIPRIGPLILPKYGRKYPSGYYNIRSMRLYTNRGLGTADLAIRINCQPEITLLELDSPLFGEN